MCIYQYDTIYDNINLEKKLFNEFLKNKNF